MSAISKNLRFLAAIRMIEAGFRIKIIASHHDVSLSMLRKMHKEIHNESPKAGQLANIDSILRTSRSLVEAAILLKIYSKLCTKPISQIDTEALMQSYMFYLAIREDCDLHGKNGWKPININNAWVLVKGLHAKYIRILRCGHYCHYIEAHNQCSKLECHTCKLLQQEDNLFKQEDKLFKDETSKMESPPK